MSITSFNGVPISLGLSRTFRNRPQLIDTDSTALGLRVFIDYCKRDLLAYSAAGFDIYKQLAAEQFDLTVDGVSPELRRQAKIASYNKLYRF